MLKTVKIDFREPYICKKTHCGRNLPFKVFISPIKERAVGSFCSHKMLQLPAVWTICQNMSSECQCGNCNQSHRISNYNRTHNFQGANCVKKHASKSTDSSVDLLTLKNFYENRNQQLPQEFHQNTRPRTRILKLRQ